MKLAKKVSERFNGIEVEHASATLTAASSARAVRPGVLASEGAVPLKPVVSIQKVVVPVGPNVHSTQA